MAVNPLYGRYYRFENGRIVISPRALIELNSSDLQTDFARHRTGKSMVTSKEQIAKNDISIKNGSGDVITAHIDKDGANFFIRTSLGENSRTAIYIKEEGDRIGPFFAVA